MMLELPMPTAGLDLVPPSGSEQANDVVDLRHTPIISRACYRVLKPCLLTAATFERR